MVHMIGLGSFCCGQVAGIWPLSSGPSGRPSGSDDLDRDVLGTSGCLLDAAISAWLWMFSVGLSVDRWPSDLVWHWAVGWALGR